MKSILKNNLDDIPDGFKEYSLNLDLNNINKNPEAQNKKKELANKINLLADSDLNSKQKLNNNPDLNPSSNKIIFLLILFLLNSCD